MLYVGADLTRKLILLFDQREHTTWSAKCKVDSAAHNNPFLVLTYRYFNGVRLQPWARGIH